MARTPRTGRPRDARTHDAILRATSELVLESGYAGTTIGAIATRAGAGKDAIYRRWSGKPELVYEAMFTASATAAAPGEATSGEAASGETIPDSSLSDTVINADTAIAAGTLLGDLTALAARLVEEFASPAALAALAGVLADLAADDVLHARLRTHFLQQERARLAEAFTRAGARGELSGTGPIDPGLVLDTMAGALFFRLAILREAPSSGLADQLARLVVNGIGRA